LGERANGRTGESAIGSAWRKKQLAECGYRNNISFKKFVMDAIKHFRDLHVYQGGKALVMQIFEVSKTFPVEERYALTDQVRLLRVSTTHVTK
jgi:hypothetical protein